MALRILLSTLIALQSLFVLTLALPGDAPGYRVWVVKRDVENPEIPLKESEVKVSSNPPKIYSLDIVSDIRLRYSLTKVSSKVANPSDVAQETTFNVVLPETAFISSFLMEIDGKVYKASVKEKEKAQEEYQSAVDAGQSAAQVTADARDANQFTVSVNIEPKAKILFNLTYEELLTRRRSIYEQVIHVNPGAIVPKMSVTVNIFETLPINKIVVPQLRTNEITDEDSSENEVAKITRLNETMVTVVYEPSESQQNKTEKGLEGQFVVQYDVDRSSTERKGGEIHVVDGYFVHFFAPSTLPTLPKHVIFVLDTSGSMAGTRIEQTKQAMNSILDQLRPEDVFSVVEFSGEVTEWNLRKPYEGPEKGWHSYRDPTEVVKNETDVKNPFGLFDDIFAYPVTNRSVERAKEFVGKMEVTSATNINDALLLALKNSQSVRSRIRLTPIIIFLTDGEPTSSVTNKDDILANVRKANSDDLVSIFCLAFGTGTDYDFLAKVASQNRGFARKIYEAADATLQLKGFFDEVASPLLNNVQFIYNDKGPVSDVTETKISNYFKGTEFVIAGRIQTGTELVASVTGTSSTGLYTVNDILPFPFPFPPIVSPVITKPEVPAENKFSLEKVWAYLTIQDMLKKRQSIDDAKAIDQFNEKALNLSLKYEFVTPLTSLVVVKPNEAPTDANIRPADGSGSSGSFNGQNYFSPSLAGGFGGVAAYGVGGPAPAFALAYAPSPPLKLHDTHRRTTTFRPYAPSVELLENTESLPFSSPLPWIQKFNHNDTHVDIPMESNTTRSLLWQDELPDVEYYSCSTNKTEGISFCKSIWKCASLDWNARLATEDEPETCVIDQLYVGICCVPSDELTTEAESINTEPDVTDSTTDANTAIKA